MQVNALPPYVKLTFRFTFSICESARRYREYLIRSFLWATRLKSTNTKLFWMFVLAVVSHHKTRCHRLQVFHRSHIIYKYIYIYTIYILYTIYSIYYIYYTIYYILYIVYRYIVIYIYIYYIYNIYSNIYTRYI